MSAGFKVDQFPVIVRCSGLEAEALCPNIRDELQGLTDWEKGTISVTDDVGTHILGEDWTRLLADRGAPVEPLNRLAVALGAKRVVLLDSFVADLIEGNGLVLPGVRLNLQARVWEESKSAVVSTIQDVGLKGFKKIELSLDGGHTFQPWPELDRFRQEDAKRFDPREDWSSSTYVDRDGVRVDFDRNFDLRRETFGDARWLKSFVIFEPPVSNKGGDPDKHGSWQKE